MIRILMLTCAALLAATACTPLSARPLVDVSIVDRDSGQWLQQYRARGDAWVAGEPGHRYAVRLTNTTGERVLVVLSVDGVNAVSGEDADPLQDGYVLEPWQSAEIAGWRKSMQDVAQFYFTDLPDSYAARTGRPDNVGVIGLAAFREHVRDVRPYRDQPPLSRAETMRGATADKPSPAAAPSANADAIYEPESRQRIGTGHGAREFSPVANTDFVRASSRAAQVTQIRYDAPERLAALGILPRDRAPYPTGSPTPQAFPSGFVPDPSPRW